MWGIKWVKSRIRKVIYQNLLELKGNYWSNYKEKWGDKNIFWRRNLKYVINIQWNIESIFQISHPRSIE